MSPSFTMFWITLTASIFLLFASPNTGVANRIPPAFISRGGSAAFTTRDNLTLHPSFTRLQQRQSRHTLSSTMERGNNNPNTDEKKSDKISYNVIYQKVLRSSKKSSHTFLLDLITYLQSMYELPDGLTMPYELSVPDEDNTDNRAILIIDSPLANDASEARIEVEVIGIFPETDDGASMSLSPTMAMVALKKIKSKNGSGNAVTQGLFGDCEKRIVNSFDRGLQDLEEGRVTIPSALISDEAETGTTASETTRQDEFVLDDDGIDAAIKRMGYENAVNAASTDVIKHSDAQINEPKVPISIERDEMGNVIIDSKSPSAVDEIKQEAKAAEVKTKASSSSPPPQVTAQELSKKPQTKKAKQQPQPQPLKSVTISKTKQTTTQSTKEGKENEEFAIQMARKKAEALMTTLRIGTSTSSLKGTINISGGESEFAILAAKRAAACLQSKPISKKSSKGQEATVSTRNSETPQKKVLKAQDLRNDTMFLKLQSIANKSKDQSWSKTIYKKPEGKSADGAKVKKADVVGEKGLRNDGKVAAASRKSQSDDKVVSDVKLKKTEDGTGKKGPSENYVGAPSAGSPSDNKVAAASLESQSGSKVDPSFVGSPTSNDNADTSSLKSQSDNKLQADPAPLNAKQPDQQKSDDEIREDIAKVARENQEVQDLLKSATNMLPDDGDEDLSPEELLERVLKFGDEKEKEEKPGYGFVEGAMGRAKDLLQPKQDTNNNGRELGYKELDPNDERKRKAEEDELKKIFAAGQNTAQEKLSKPPPTPAEIMKTPITEEEIDALIAADETVPLNARVLDEELAEFEVRVSRTAGEENDGPAKNKMFDIFSGPEVYNPNVDPATAVNWPGAKEGTRTDVRLAKDLEVALKQAKFAAAVLLNMREEESDSGVSRYFVGEKEIAPERVEMLQNCVSEAVKAGIIEDPEIRLTERARLQMLVDELISQPEERLEEIALNYKDLLLSDNFIDLVRERLHAMAQRDIAARRDGKEEVLKEAHAKERAIMMKLVEIAQTLLKEVQALGAELEVSMLEIIRSICEVAMDPRYKTEEDTAIALTDAVRDMRPLLDDAFVAYLKYAIAEEEAKLERQGVVDDPEYNRWLMVLKIVQGGVYAELGRGVKRYIDHIGYVLRMKTKGERKALLAKLIEVMPTMDVRPFVKVVGNIVSSLGTSVRGDFVDGVVLGDMTNKLLQLQRDVDELLPPERVNEMSKDADNWAAKQRERLLERQKMTRQRLRAARETGSIDPDEVILSGEYERFD